jgi:hypothetical protein
MWLLIGLALCPNVAAASVVLVDSKEVVITKDPPAGGPSPLPTAPAPSLTAWEHSRDDLLPPCPPTATWCDFRVDDRCPFTPRVRYAVGGGLCLYTDAKAVSRQCATCCLAAWSACSRRFWPDNARAREDANAVCASRGCAFPHESTPPPIDADPSRWEDCGQNQPRETGRWWTARVRCLA